MIQVDSRIVSLIQSSAGGFLVGVEMDGVLIITNAVETEEQLVLLENLNYEREVVGTYGPLDLPSIAKAQRADKLSVHITVVKTKLVGLRLSPQFVALYPDLKISAGATFDSIMEVIPITLENPGLLSALISTMDVKYAVHSESEYTSRTLEDLSTAVDENNLELRRLLKADGKVAIEGDMMLNLFAIYRLSESLK